MSMTGVVRLGLVAALLLAACGSVQSQVAADSACSGVGKNGAQLYGTVTGVSGSFSVTAKDVADWEETRMGPTGPQVVSNWRSRAPAEPVTVCFFDGSFPNFPSPKSAPSDTSAPLPYDRLVMVVGADSQPVLFVVGNHSRLLPERPQRKLP